MCFSQGASFGAAIVLGIAGVAAISKVKNNRQLPFAGIPIIFGMQQLSEGMVWNELKHGCTEPYQGIYGFIFLIFAQIVWPVWVPLSLFLIEETRSRKRILGIILIIGIIATSYLAYCLFENSFTATIYRGHIHYELACYYKQSSLIGLFYLIPTILSPFISDIPKMRFIGIVLILSFIVSKLFYTDNVISVWCYFAAVLSAFIFWIMRDIGTVKKLRDEQ